MTFDLKTDEIRVQDYKRKVQAEVDELIKFTEKYGCTVENLQGFKKRMGEIV